MLSVSSPFLRILLICVVCAAGAVPAEAQAPDPGGPAGQGNPVRLAEADFEAVRLKKIVTAVRIAGGITLDGRLDEPEWKLASPVGDFIQRVPTNGMPSGERTEVRVLYDDDNLYFGVMCYDSQPSRIVVKELKRDFDLNGTDMIQLVIDSLHDGLGGYSLSVNPAGARRDNHLGLNGGGVNWDAVWDVGTRRTEEGWIAEYQVPFKSLRFSNAPSQEWGLQVSRRILRLNEESTWTPLPFRFSTSQTNLAGTLRGLENVSPGRNLKVKPYILGEVTQARIDGDLQTTKTFRKWDDFGKGFDVKYSLTPSLTLDTTYRTDFAQVEADQQQVNLTRFNLFFPEKREFFLENANVFSFGPGGNLVPFFSRRIGLSAAGTPVPVLRRRPHVWPRGQQLERRRAGDTDRQGRDGHAREQLHRRAREAKSPHELLDRRPGHPPRLVHLRRLQPRLWRRRALPVLRRPAGVRWLRAQERHAGRSRARTWRAGFRPGGETTS